jgi:hypothetical protein
MVVSVAVGRSAFDVVVVFFSDVELAADDGLEVVFFRCVEEI